MSTKTQHAIEIDILATVDSILRAYHRRTITTLAAIAYIRNVTKKESNP